MTSKEPWADLIPRIGTAFLLIGSAAIALLLGGNTFGIFLLVAVALLHWELGCMLSPLSRQTGYFAAAFAGLFFLLAIASVSLEWSLVCVILGSAVQIMFFQRFKKTGLAISLAIFLVSLLFLNLRLYSDLSVILWLVGVVVMTDLGGYFGGRIFGGPKLTPRYSPKKTWSGALTGLAFALVFTVIFGEDIGVGLSLKNTIIFSLFLSIASQIGDIYESALKRACNVKDSSSLLPGHGGFMDRFDGLVAASLAFSPITLLDAL